jgi:protein ImuA
MALLSGLSAPGATLAPVPPPASLQGRALHPPPPPGERAGPAAAVLTPEALHPALWLGHQLGRSAPNAVPSGFAVLDAQLPGGGWPRRALTELLLPHPGVGEIRLLAPSLAATQGAGRLVMLFDPPATLSAWALAALGLDVEQLLVIDTRAEPVPGGGGSSSGSNGNRSGRRHETLAALDGRLWALEQALKSGHVGALVAWLPARLRGERLRRLQLAAQAHDGPAFVLREWAALQRPSAAPLRLGLRAGGADVLAVRLLKRRGPPLEAPLRLALPSVLSGIAQQRAVAGVHNGALPAGAHNGAPTPEGYNGALTPEGYNGALTPPGPAALPAATFVNLA